jgi:hypothetical protein
MGLGQKRKHETVSLNEDGSGGVARTMVYLHPYEFAAANTGILHPCMQSPYGSMSTDTLDEMPRQYRRAARKGVAKNIPIWVDEGDS